MIVPLQEIVKKADVKDIPTLEQISKGHDAEAEITVDGKPERIPISGNSKPFVYNFFVYSDYLVEAAESFQGQILVDLGAGRRLDSHTFAEVVGAKAHIAVDARNMKSLYEKMRDPVKLKGDDEINKMIKRTSEVVISRTYDPQLAQKLRKRMQKYLKVGLGKLPVALLAEDMLTSLKRFPDNSVSVLASGIDKCIHPEDGYARLVEDEITRVLHPNGAYVGFFSRFEPKGLRNITKVQKDWTFAKYSK